MVRLRQINSRKRLAYLIQGILQTVMVVWILYDYMGSVYLTTVDELDVCRVFDYQGLDCLHNAFLDLVGR